VKIEYYDDQTLVLYLLGSLAADQAESIDQLSVIDEDFASRVETIEADLIDAYVAGQLSGRTLEDFTSRYLASPRRRERVAFATDFQKMLAGAAFTSQGLNAASLESQSNSPDSHVASFHRNRAGRWSPAARWALAAAALALVFLGAWIALTNARLNADIRRAREQQTALVRTAEELRREIDEMRSAGSEKEKELESLRQRLAQVQQQQQAQGSGVRQQTDVPNILSFLLTPQTRGINQPPQLSLAAAVDYVTLQLDLEPVDFTVYRAELKTAGGQVAWRSGRLRAKRDGAGRALHITVRAGLLKSGRYSIIAYGIASDGNSEPVGTYNFTVVR